MQRIHTVMTFAAKGLEPCSLSFHSTPFTALGREEREHEGGQGRRDGGGDGLFTGALRRSLFSEIH